MDVSDSDAGQVAKIVAVAVRERWLIPAAVALLLCAAASSAQELTPRAYWPAPEGTRIGIIGYSYTDGDVVLDPSIPVYDGRTRVSSALLGYMQSLKLFGRSSNILFKLPYAWGSNSAVTEAGRVGTEFSNFADLSVTLSINLRGAPSMNAEQFETFRAEPRPILGMSVEVIAPTGHYSSDRYINTGANRWAIKPEVGFIYPLTDKVLLELAAGVWFYGDDDDFINGKKEQDPIFTYKAHLVRRFSPGFWMSLDWTYYQGGRQTISGSKLSDRQSNSRLGGTFVKPLSRRQVIKLGYATGVRSGFGTDSDQLLISYQFVLN